MATKVAINGFGRIGRLVFRALVEQGLVGNEIEVVAVGDIVPADNLAYLLKYDSTQGRFNGTVSSKKSSADQADDDVLVVNDKDIQVVSAREPSGLPWKDMGVEVVIESTGLFTAAEKAKGHIEAGAKKVIISAPAKGDGIATLVMGVNHETYDPAQHHLISNASCTTNCLAPMVEVLDKAFTVRQGLMTTIHSYTNDQNLVDKAHGDLLRARAAAVNMIPTSTGAAKAVALVLPHLQGRLDGLAVRVPTLNVSLVDLTATLDQVDSLEQVHEALSNAAHGHLQGIMAINHLPLVSSDFNHLPYSCVVDTNHSRLLGQQLKLLAWYDNEWGFSHRMLDVAAYWMDA